MGKRTSNVAAHVLTPRTNDAIAATRAAGFYLGQEYAVLTVLCRTLERENGLLRGALANAADAASRRSMPFDEEISADVVARGWLQTPNVEGEGPPERRSRGGNQQAQLVGGPSRPTGWATRRKVKK